MSLEKLTKKLILEAAQEASQNPQLEVEGAGPSKSYFLRFRGQILGQKLVVKRALEKLGIDRKDREHQSINGHKRLLELGLGNSDSDLFAFYSNGPSSAEYYIRKTSKADRLSRSHGFRSAVMETWSSTCAITGCNTELALEAAHIIGVAKGGSDHPSNGIALRRDIHTLFDANLIAISPQGQNVWISKEIAADYSKYDGTRIKIPKSTNLELLKQRWENR